MSIVSGSKPQSGDPIKHEHAAYPAAGMTGGLYASDPSGTPTASVGASGAVPAGNYKYQYTHAFRDPVTDIILGETAPSPASSTVSPGVASIINVSGVTASSNDMVNTRRVYRQAGGAGSYFLVGEILDNTTTTFADNLASTTGQPVAPSTNTTGQSISLNNPVHPTNAVFTLSEEGTDCLKLRSDGVSLQGPVPSILQRNASQVTITGASEGTMATYTVPAALLTTVVGSGMRYTLAGTITCSDANATLALKVKFGGTTIMNSGGAGAGNTFKPNAQNTRWHYCLQVWFLHEGVAANKQRWSAMITGVTDAGPPGWAIFTARDTPSADENWLVGSGYAESSISTGIDRVFEITAQWTAGTGTITKEASLLELFPPGDGQN